MKDMIFLVAKDIVPRALARFIETSLFMSCGISKGNNSLFLTLKISINLNIAYCFSVSSESYRIAIKSSGSTLCNAFELSSEYKF